MQELTSGVELSGEMKLNKDVLYQKCKQASFERPLDNLRLAQNLFQLMMKENGIGLAANQTGHDIRLFVMFVEREAFHCFNPEIVTSSQDCVIDKEGCLSFPGERCMISRPATIKVKYANARGNFQERIFSGLAARCFQHELDHLNGVTMHDRQQVNV